MQLVCARQDTQLVAVVVIAETDGTLIGRFFVRLVPLAPGQILHYLDRGGRRLLALCFRHGAIDGFEQCTVHPLAFTRLT